MLKLADGIAIIFVQIFQTTEAGVITSFVHARLMLLPLVILCGRCCAI